MPVTEPASRLAETLRCPLCAGGLEQRERSLVCPRGHSFDLARQGYVSLLSGGAHLPSSDTAEMVQARVEVLSGGHYAHLTDALAKLAREACPAEGRVVDAGTGTGHYLAAVLDALPRAYGVGLDASKYAARRAARAHPRALAATWDLWQPLPVRTASTDLLLNVFAPRNVAEYHRVLKPGGTLVVVTPAEGHLAELRAPLGLLGVEEAKSDRLGKALADRFVRVHEEVVSRRLSVDARAAADLVLMGPTGHHVPARVLRERAESLRVPYSVTAAFRLAAYRPVDDPPG